MVVINHWLEREKKISPGPSAFLVVVGLGREGVMSPHNYTTTASVAGVGQLPVAPNIYLLRICDGRKISSSYKSWIVF